MSRDESAKLIDTLKLSDQQWAELSAKIDRLSTQGGGQRRHERVPFRMLSQIAVAIQQSDQLWAKFVVRSRDLSPCGIGFIHGTYVHTGSPCRVILKDVAGQVACIEGIVRRCDLLQGRAHNVGVQFNEEVHLARFIPADSSDSGESKRDVG